MSSHEALTDAEKEHFDSEGYLVRRGVLSQEQVQPARESLVDFLGQKPRNPARRLDIERSDGSRFVWMSDLHSTRPALQELLYAPSLTRTAAALLDDTRSVRLAQDTAFFKEAGRGGAVGWHQDGSYWQHAQPLQMVSAWVALTESTIETGCLTVIPQSHQWGLQPSTVLDAFSADAEAFLKSKALADRIDTAQRVPLELAPGDVSFHHGLTIHGSGENRSAQDRLGYVILYLPEEAHYRAAEARFWQRSPQLVDGQPFQGPQHPLLWQRKA